MALGSTIIASIAERYAHALYDLAEEKGALDAVAADLRGLDKLLEESEDLRRLINSPVISRSEQAQALAAIAQKGKLNPLTGNVLGLLAGKRRAFVLPALIRAFLARLAARRGEIVAKVTTAQALSPAQTSALTAALKKVVGGEVSLDISIDPRLLAGMVVRVGSRMVDGSLATKLSRLRLAMKGTG